MSYPGEDGDPIAGKGGGFEVGKACVLWVATWNQISVPLCHTELFWLVPRNAGALLSFHTLLSLLLPEEDSALFSLELNN